MWCAVMNSESYQWIGFGDTEEKAKLAIVKEWNKSPTRTLATLKWLEEYYSFWTTECKNGEAKVWVKEQWIMIDYIVNRAEELGINYSKRITHLLDMENACKTFNLDLDAMLNADDENFIHDYLGIYNNIDRIEKTFGLYVPRFAREV